MKKNQAFFTIVISALTLFVVTAILVTSIFLVRTKLLQNAQSMGMALAESYAKEEEITIKMLEDFLDLGAQYANDINNEHRSEDIHAWMTDYFSKLTNILGDQAISPYAVIDGHIVAQYPWEGDEDYPYADQEWYQLAIQDKNTVVFTDAYEDVITKETVITASIGLENDGDVLAMDIYPEKMHDSTSFTATPNSSYYVSDKHGNFIYAVTPKNFTKEEHTTYTKKLFDGVKNGDFADYDDFYLNKNGVNVGVYYHEISNGWLVIMVIPVNDLLMGDSNFLIYFLAAIGIALIAILCFMFIHNIRQMHLIHSFDETIDILSDSYYAMYRINLNNGTYEVLKRSLGKDLEINKSGKYEDLLKVLSTVVEKGAYQEFNTSFSLSSIHQRILEKIYDYGGDFKRRFGDEYRWVNVRTLYNDKVSKKTVVLCFKDVEIEKKQELQHLVLLQNTLEENKKNIEAKTAFFNNVSHDMRTPLNAVLGFSNLAIEHVDDQKKVLEYLKKITYSANQLLTLINDILELAKIESGHQHLDYKPFDIQKLIDNTCGIFIDRSRDEQKQFEVIVNLENPCILGDEFKLSQILNNLLSNSIKYSENGARITLDISEKKYQNHRKLQIIVDDTGIGMSKEFLKHLFEPYARETHFNVKSTVGTGLGMPIVKNLVEQMSGEIYVESELGVGTKFTVLIPFELPEQNLESTTNTLANLNLLEGKRVLLVEDNELNIEIATEILELNGMKVVCANNGKEAIDIFQSSAPFAFDIILMDMQMPIMDGCQATQQIRQLDKPDADTIPIIALTANAFSEDITKALRAGMNAHVSKPIDIKVLCQVINDMLNQKHPK